MHICLCIYIYYELLDHFCEPCLVIHKNVILDPIKNKHGVEKVFDGLARNISTVRQKGMLPVGWFILYIYIYIQTRSWWGSVGPMLMRNHQDKMCQRLVAMVMLSAALPPDFGEYVEWVITTSPSLVIQLLIILFNKFFFPSNDDVVL